MYFLARMDTAFSAEGMYAGFVLSRSIYGGFRDQAVDKMIADARSIVDEEQREKAFFEINRVLREEKVPLVFLYQNFEIFAKHKKLTWTPRIDAKLLAYEVGLKE
jgi:ABC-type transport system substrate-binding protein